MTGCPSLWGLLHLHIVDISRKLAAPLSINSFLPLVQLEDGNGLQYRPQVTWQASTSELRAASRRHASTKQAHVWVRLHMRLTKKCLLLSNKKQNHESYGAFVTSTFSYLLLSCEQACGWSQRHKNNGYDEACATNFEDHTFQLLQSYSLVLLRVLMSCSLATRMNL